VSQPGALKGHYGDHWSHLKVSTQLNGESVQTFSAAFEQLANWVLVGLLKDYIHREGSLYVRCWSEGRGVKQHLMGGERLLNQALNLEAVRCKSRSRCGYAVTRN
jgi:hypothetical protein